jgi:hypothetical protein
VAGLPVPGSWAAATDRPSTRIKIPPPTRFMEASSDGKKLRRPGQGVILQPGRAARTSVSPASVTWVWPT